MKTKVVIVMLVVFSCAIPQALGHYIVKTAAECDPAREAAEAIARRRVAKLIEVKTAAVQAAKKSKVATIAGAANLALKGAAVAGAIALGTKAAVLGAHAAGAKLSLIKPWFLGNKSIPKPITIYTPVYELHSVVLQTQKPPLMLKDSIHQRLRALWNTTQEAIQHKVSAARKVITNVHDAKKSLFKTPTKIPVPHTVYGVPVTEKSAY